jgi:hypothetical protein
MVAAQGLGERGLGEGRAQVPGALGERERRERPGGRESGGWEGDQGSARLGTREAASRSECWA